MTTPLPSVPDFIAGFGPQKSDMQSLWVNAAAFFQQRVIFRASQTTTTTSLPASGALTAVGFDTILEDPYSGWNAGTLTWTPPANYGGWYQVTTTVFIQAPGVSGVGLKIGINELQFGLQAVVVSPVAGIGGAEATWYLHLETGLGVQVTAGLQNSVSAISTNDSATGQQSTLEITWISS